MGKEGTQTNVNNLTTGKSIAKQLVLFVIPIWLGTFFQQLYNAADAMFVGRFVGKAALAAVGGPTSQIVNLLVGVFVELAAGSSVIIAQYFGAKCDKKAGRAIHTAMAVAIICGVFITAAGLVFSPILLRSMDVEGDVFKMANTYLRIYFSGTLFITIYNMGSSALRALGDSKRPFYYLVSGCLTNIVLDYVLIRWVGWGVAGAAIATVISEALSTVLIIRALCHLSEDYRLHFKQITIHCGTLKRMLSIGVPEGMQQVLYSISNILIQTNIDGFGTDSIAAMSAYSKVDAFFWLTLESFGIAITAMAGQFYGAGRISGLKKSVRICLVICAGIAVVISVLLLLVGRTLFGLFTDDPNVITIAVQIQRLLVPSYIVFIFVIVLAGALRGMGHSFVPMFITLVGICLLRIIWIYSFVPLRPELMTTLFSYPITWVMTSLAFIVYYRKKIKDEERLHCSA